MTDAHDTATAALPTPAAGPAMRMLDVASIEASLTNPRKFFNPDKLQELANSIAASGVHQPILVRPLPGHRVPDTFGNRRQGQPLPAYELVAGERRLRACRMAGVTEIPAMIREINDNDVLEIQIVENLQRDDLSELEEAVGYEHLMQHSSVNADQVAAKIGKSRSYVYGRLKLLDLASECQDALRLGAIDASRAQLIARIPDGKLQLKALKEATEVRDGQTCSVRAFQVWLRQNVMLPLEHAPFDITDARLVVAAGSCKDCPKRTGANPDIFADVGGADICTDPPCYQGKASTHELRNIALAESKGLRLICGAEAKTICYEKSSTLKGYSPLSQVRDDAGGQRLDQLLGKAPEGGVLIENPWTHQLIEAVPTAEAEGTLIAKGLVQAVQTQASQAVKADNSIEKLQTAMAREIENGFREAAYSAISKAIHATPGPLTVTLLTPALLRVWLMQLVDEYPCREIAPLLQMTLDDDLTESQNEAVLRLRLQSADSATLYKTAALHLISLDKLPPYPLQKENPTPLFAAAAAPLCIDLPALRASVTKTAKADLAEKIAAIKAAAKPPKAPPPTAPLAQPVVMSGADAKTKPQEPGKNRPAGAPRVAPKLSAQEALSGIATAMQGIEAGSVANALPLPVNAAEPAEGATPLTAMNTLQPGLRVRVNDSVLSPQMAKWIGKEGVITEVLSSGDWMVKFFGKKGGVCEFHSFDASELERVE